MITTDLISKKIFYVPWGFFINTFFYVDSRYIYAKKKEFLSEDGVNVSTDEEDATKCCPTAKQHSSP